MGASSSSCLTYVDRLYDLYYYTCKIHGWLNQTDETVEAICRFIGWDQKVAMDTAFHEYLQNRRDLSELNRQLENVSFGKSQAQLPMEKLSEMKNAKADRQEQLSDELWLRREDLRSDGSWMEARWLKQFTHEELLVYRDFIKQERFKRRLDQ